MKKVSLILITVFNLLLLSCNCDESPLMNQITFDNVEILRDVLPSEFCDAVRFSSQNTAYTITNNGKIFKTEDEGNTWVQQNSGTEIHLYDMFFLDDLHGYIVGGAKDEGLILKTTDGGNTWSSMNFQDELNSIYFINETSGFAAGGKLFKTQDGGETWNEVNLGFFKYQKINFFDRETGLLAATDPETLQLVVFKTIDGGIHWIKLNNINFGLNTIHKIQIVDGIAYLFASGGKIFKTPDMGNTWQVITTPGLNSGYFINERQAIGVGQWWYTSGYFPEGIFYLTNDGWKHWEEKHTKGVEEFFSIEDIDFYNDSTALAVGNTGGCVIRLRF